MLEQNNNILNGIQIREVARHCVFLGIRHVSILLGNDPRAAIATLLSKLRSLIVLRKVF